MHYVAEKPFGVFGNAWHVHLIPTQCLTAQGLAPDTLLRSLACLRRDPATLVTSLFGNRTSGAHARPTSFEENA
jgi:hypothetical protein